MLVSMMPLSEATFADLVEGAARLGMPMTTERARHVESLVHEAAHALLLGVEFGPSMGPEISERLDAMERSARDWNEIDTLAIEVAVFREWGFVDGVEPPGFLKAAAHAMAVALGSPDVEELLAEAVMDQSREAEARARAVEVIGQLREWEGRAAR